MAQGIHILQEGWEVNYRVDKKLVQHSAMDTSGSCLGFSGKP